MFKEGGGRVFGKKETKMKLPHLYSSQRAVAIYFNDGFELAEKINALLGNPVEEGSSEIIEKIRSIAITQEYIAVVLVDVQGGAEV